MALLKCSIVFSTAMIDGRGVDCMSEFQLGDKRYCYPLTVTDHASRYLLLCDAMESSRQELALQAFERLSKERG